MATIPTTLIGLVGFMLFVAFLIGQVTTTETKSNMDKLNSDLQSTINVALDDNQSAFNQFVGSLNVLTVTLKVIVSYFTNFIIYSSELPPQFLVLFVIIFISGIMGIVFLIRGV